MSSMYVVTTSARGVSKSQIWNPSSPLGLGHPFHWILERTEKGVRVRTLTDNLNEVQKIKLKEIAEDKLQEGAQVELDDLSIQIRSVREVAPAYEERGGNHINIFACLGDWIMGSETLEGLYTGYANKEAAFHLRKSSGNYQLAVQAAELHITNIDKESSSSKAYKKGDTVPFTAEQLTRSQLQLGALSWRFNSVQIPNIPQGKKSKALSDEENDWFKRASGYAVAVFGMFTIMSWFWPKPEVKELVPPQFAKIVMSKTQSTPSQSSQAPIPAAAASAPKKVQDAAVVQAFRAQALNNAVSGLLKGGMSKLLAQSDFVAGTKATENARQIFAQKSSALGVATPNSGLTDKNIKVASLGGQGTATDVGYTKGQHAAVKGQGSAFVNMDIGGANVEEGLTKDEVGEVIHRHLSEVRYCYESAMLRTPDIEGKLIVNFTIGGSGMVKTSEVKNSTLPDPRLDDCILRRLVTWKFPQTKGAIDVAVSYPFIFKTLGR